MSDDILQVQDLKTYVRRRGILPGMVTTNKIVDGISFQLARGETLGIVGESGCGKSVLLRTILHLMKPTAGSILVNGEDISKLSGKRLHEVRRRMQVIFQNPYTSLHPRMSVAQIITEPMAIYKIGDSKTRLARAKELMELVGLDPTYHSRYPHQFSGGQRQRIGIARALALDPELLLLDEPVSALDVSIQAQVLNLLKDLQDRLNLTYIFVAHDLSVLKHVSDRIAVMLAGRFVELGDANQVYSAPLHPYTKSLLSATPSLRKGIAGVPIEAIDRTNGKDAGSAEDTACPYLGRCPSPGTACTTACPSMSIAEPGHSVSCHLYSSTELTSGN